MNCVPVKGSGSGYKKGDLIHERWVIQHKYVHKITLNQKLLLKCINDAETYLNKKPAIVVTFRNGDQLAVIPVDTCPQNNFTFFIEKTGKVLDMEKISCYYVIRNNKYPYWKVISIGEFSKCL